MLQILDLPEEKDEDDIDASTAGSSGKSAVIKTTTRQVNNSPATRVTLLARAALWPAFDAFACALCRPQTVFLPIVGLVETDTLKPADLVGSNKDTYLILDKLPPEYVGHRAGCGCACWARPHVRVHPRRYDSRVKAMEVDEKPTEQYSDIGGLGKQIQELREAIVLPMTHAEEFKAIGITPPKGEPANPAGCSQLHCCHPLTCLFGTLTSQACSCTARRELERRS